MKLIKLHVKNFGSYRELDFDLANKGLSLIHGATGSGKSTLQDVPCWILFGETAKGGNADEVKSWTAQQPTEGQLTVEVSKGDYIEIYRSRGRAGQNDLYWVEKNGTRRRGKDLTETQGLLNARLGFDSTLYTTSAYFSEFAPTANFFLAKARERREILEHIANLDLPVLLADAASNARKGAKKELTDMDAAAKYQQGRLEQTTRHLKQTMASYEQWTENQKSKIESLKVQSELFEVQKASKIEALVTRAQAWEHNRSAGIDAALQKAEEIKRKITPTGEIESKIAQAEAEATCNVCGSPSKEAYAQIKKYNTKLMENQKLQASIQQALDKVKQLEAEVNPYDDQIVRAKGETNQLVNQISSMLTEENPYLSQVERLRHDEAEAKAAIGEVKASIEKKEHEVLTYTQIYNLSLELRGKLLTQAVSTIESKTNESLERYFDSEFRVILALDADKVDVLIKKGGHDCTYTQLSKGQRALLKLCFMTSVMDSAANRAGVHFDTLFFDEALDGLDSELKVKAFDLFSAMEREHGSIFLIDHSTEFKSMFTNQYHVELVGDYSHVREA